MTTSSQATYNAGSVINLGWWIQVNHGGRIGVKVCPSKSISQACFDQNPLFRADAPSERFVYIMSGPSLGSLSMNANFRLPTGVSCTGGCVLQWEYLTMNSCFEPCNSAVCGQYANRVNPITGQRGMANCCLGSGCPAANVPEVFRNCADITINGSGGGGVPPPAPTCSRTAAPGAQCGGGTCCPSGQCCSQYGWCGVTSGHCATGCQKSFGSCWNARLPRTARAGGLLGASNSTGAPADVDRAIDGHPVSRSSAAGEAVVEPGLEPTSVEVPVDPARGDATIAPAYAVALERAAVADAAAAAAVADPDADVPAEVTAAAAVADPAIAAAGK